MSRGLWMRGEWFAPHELGRTEPRIPGELVGATFMRRGEMAVISGVIYMHPDTLVDFIEEIERPSPTAAELARWADDGGSIRQNGRRP